MSKRHKYIVHPGYVQSVHDGQYHWIGFLELVKLYGLSLDECLNAETTRINHIDWNRLTHLYPARDGNYGK